MILIIVMMALFLTISSTLTKGHHARGSDWGSNNYGVCRRSQGVEGEACLSGARSESVGGRRRLRENRYKSIALEEGGKEVRGGGGGGGGKGEQEWWKERGERRGGGGGE